MKKRKPVSLRSAKVREIALNLTTLGLVRVEKGEALNVRQRENLRRALTEAGEELDWAEVVAVSEDPVTAVAKDVKKMVRSGARSMKREIADELARKKKEEAQLEAVVEKVQDMAEDPKVVYPTEITYHRTANDASRGLITKVETVTVADADEALQTAQTIERSRSKWGKLRTQMLEELKQTQKSLGELSGNVAQVVDSWRGLLKEVIATLPLRFPGER